VRALPAELASTISLAPGPLDALAGASALVVATEWPELIGAISGASPGTAAAAFGAMRRRLVLDANRFLAKALVGIADVEYYAVGVPAHG
jgi:hypothetical protein